MKNVPLPYRTILCSMLLFFSASTTKAQTFCKNFAGAYYSYGLSVIETAGGGYLFAGTLDPSGPTPTQLYLVKTGSDGNTTWNKTIGGASDEEGTDVAQASNGDYYISGYTYSYGQGSADLYLIRMNASGTVLWAKTIGGADTDVGTQVVAHLHNGCIVAGNTSSFGAGNGDGYLVRFDSTGNLLWSKTYGGTSNEGFESMIKTSTGKYLLAGHTNSFGSGLDDGYLVMVDSTGTPLWSKAIGGTGDDVFRSVAENNDGTFTAVGITYDLGALQQKLYIVKMDASGNLLTTRKYNTSKDMVITSIHTIAGGDLILSGSVSEGAGTTWAAALIRLDAAYNVVWAKKTAEFEYTHFAQALTASDNGLLVVGNTEDKTVLSMLDASGNACPGCAVNDFTMSMASGGTALNTTTSVSTGGVTGTGGLVGTGGTQEDLCSTLDLNTDAAIESEMFFYPNPSAGMLHLNIPFAAATLQVINPTGQRVYEQSISPSLATVDLGHLPEGIYLLQLVSGNNRYSQKLVIKK